MRVCMLPGCNRPLSRSGRRYCGHAHSNMARLGRPISPRRDSTSNSTTRVRKFSAAMWDAWQTDRTPDAHTLKLRAGIEQLRDALGPSLTRRGGTTPQR